MFEKLEIFRMAHSFAGHAAARHSAIARNIANSDTPGYRATDIAPFSETFSGAGDNHSMRVTRAGHFDRSDRQEASLIWRDAGGETSPNGNNVSLETEMMRATEVRHQHDLALSIYSASLNILKTSLGRGR